MFMPKRKKQFFLLVAIILPIMSALCVYCTRLFLPALSLKYYLIDHKIADDVSFSFGDTAGIRLKLSPDPVFYLACLPAEARVSGDLNISFSHFGILELDGCSFYSGDDIYDFACDNEDSPVTMRIISRQGDVLYDGYVQFMFADNIPTVYIMTDPDALEMVNRTDYEDTDPIHIPAALRIINPDGSMDSSADVLLHRHGNTSFDFYEPRPYNIDLSENYGLLGMTPGNRWVLKSDSEYPTVVMKNEAAFEVARRLEGLSVPESRFVNVYVNDEYYGFYQLCQRVQTEEMMNYANKRALVERDVRYEVREHFFEYDGEGIAIHLPKRITDEEADEIAELFCRAADAVKSGDDLERYIDIDSFVKMYMLQDFFVQTDVDGDSLYFYIGDDDKIYAGPVWDFDCACGHISSGPYHGSITIQARYFNDFGKIFFKDLQKSETFRECCVKYYQDKMSGIVHEYIDTKFREDAMCIERSMDIFAFAREFGATGLGADNNLTALGEWLEDRVLFLDEYYKDAGSYKNVRFNFAWGSMTVAVKEGEPIGFLPDDEHLNNSDDMWGEINGFEDETGQIVSDDMIINEDMSLYAVYDEDSPTVREGLFLR